MHVHAFFYIFFNRVVPNLRKTRLRNIVTETGFGLRTVTNHSVRFDGIKMYIQWGK